MKNICIFGDSIGKGVALNSLSERYEIVKLDLSRILKPRQKVNIKNYSSFGCTVTKGLSIIEKHEEKLSGYDTAILEFGGNDCNFIWEEVARLPDKEHKPNTSPEEFSANYLKAVGIVQKAGLKPVLVNLPPLDAKKFLNWISRGINGANILKWLGGVEAIYRWQEMYSLAVVKIAQKLSVSLADVRSEFLKRRDFSALLCEDGMHPTRKGHELIAKTVYENIMLQGQTA